MVVIKITKSKLLALTIICVCLVSSLYLFSKNADAGGEYYRLHPVSMYVPSTTDYAALLNKMYEEGYVYSHKDKATSKDSQDVIVFHKK